MANFDKKNDGESGSDYVDGLPVVTGITDSKLDGSNFFAWSKIVRIYLRSIGKAFHLKDKHPIYETKDQWLQNDAWCQFLYETEIPSLQDTFARVIHNETLHSPHALAFISSLVSRGRFQGGFRNGNSDRVGDSQGFSSDEVECYYYPELGHTIRNCKKLLVKTRGSSARAFATSDKTVTICVEEYARLKGSVDVNSSTSTATTAIAGTKSVELRPALQVASSFRIFWLVETSVQVASFFGIFLLAETCEDRLLRLLELLVS
ncbi:polyprotein [Tanacetum coccineum]